MTDRPPDRFGTVAEALVGHVEDGLTVTEASELVGVPYNTVRNWLTAGRQRPEGRYAGFAAAVDAARGASGEPDEEDEPGPIRREVEALISSRTLDPEGAVLAASAIALAKTADELTGGRGGSAGTALAATTRRLEECVNGLRLQPEDALSEIQRRRRSRLQETYGDGGDEHGRRA